MTATGDEKSLTGIVLAGGKSSRMGTDKAHLNWHGDTLLNHMLARLRASGAEHLLISGDQPGYPCITDSTPFAGPGCALQNVLSRLPSSSAGALIVPVDMPLLPVAALRELSRYPEGAYFSGHPLPAYLPNIIPNRKVDRVYAIHTALGTQAIDLPHQWQSYMQNINTPEQWQCLYTINIDETD